MILTGVNLLLRFVGTTFQVYLSGRIGAEGIGMLQLVLSVSTLAMVIAMGGIRTATMYLTAEELGHGKPQNIKWVLAGCVRYSVVFSGIVSIGTIFLAPLIAGKWIGDPSTMEAIRLLAIFLPVNCLCGVMTGYFTGANRIGTLATVEVIEQVLSLSITLLLLQLWAGQDSVRACSSVIMGSGIGACFTLFTLMLLRLRQKSPSASRQPMASRLLKSALPLAVGDNLRTGISTAENLIVPKRLALYPGMLSPLAAFGTVFGMVFPILMFPAAILFGLTELLIPELARCNAAKRKKRIHHLASKSLRVAMIYGTLCSGILFLTADDLCKALYNNIDAGAYLRWFAPLAVMLYCDIITDSMIKGLGYQKFSVGINILSNALDIILLYFFLPVLGIKGYFLSFLITHVINFVLSIRLLIKITGYQISLHRLIITLSSAAIGIWLCKTVTNPWMSAIAFTALLFSLLFLLGVLNKEDLNWIKGLIFKKRCARPNRAGTSKI